MKKQLNNLRQQKIASELTNILADKLSDLNDEKIAYKVEHHYWTFRHRIEALNDLKGYKQYYLKLAYIDMKKIINLYPYPKEIKSYLLNVIHALYSTELNKK